MLEQINPGMLVSFTILLSFHGVVFLKIAKNTFITKAEHDALSKKLDDRLFDEKNGMPIYVPQSGCDRRVAEDDRRRDNYATATCKKIDELKEEINKMRDILLGKMAVAGQ